MIPLFSPFVLSGPAKVNHVIGVHYRLAGICGSIYSGGDLLSPPVISLKKFLPTDGRLRVRWRRRGGWRSGDGEVVWLWDGVAYMGAGTCQIVRNGV